MIGRDLLDQIRRLLNPLKIRIANLISRAVVQRVDDGKKLQELQIGVLAGEDLDEAERFQQYGFSSVPLEGAEAVSLFPNGDRGHPLVIAVDDRRHRPTGGQPGEVTIYSHTGAFARFMDSGDIEVTPAPGREVFVRSEGGTTEPLVKKSEFEAHVHGTGVGPSSTPSVPIAGTSILKAE